MIETRKLVSACALILCGLCADSLKANYLENTDFRNGFACWEGVGDVVYLKPNGTEGTQSDKGAIPVLKIPLKRTESRLVFQEFTNLDEATHLQVKLDVRCSANFKRSVDPKDYSQKWKPGTYHYSNRPSIPQTDFWVSLNPDGLYWAGNAKAKWQTVTATFKKTQDAQIRRVQFGVPCGQGAIYIKNVVVTP